MSGVDNRWVCECSCSF